MNQFILSMPIVTMVITIDIHPLISQIYCFTKSMHLITMGPLKQVTECDAKKPNGESFRNCLRFLGDKESHSIE